MESETTSSSDTLNIKRILVKKIQKILQNLNVTHKLGFQIQKSKRQHFGDYQINGLIRIADAQRIELSVLFRRIINSLQNEDIVEKIHVSDQRFVNIFLRRKWLEEKVHSVLFSKRLGVDWVKRRKNIVVDYSSPNIAKEMHVGNMRSTVIGDAVVRVLEFLGHNVVRNNHIGDWGTQFGTIIAFVKQTQQQKKLDAVDLNDLYERAKLRYDTDPNFAHYSRRCVVKLQKGDASCKKIWKKLVRITLKRNQRIYERLNVTLEKNHVFGESYYRFLLPNVIRQLKDKKIAFEDHGAIVVRMENKTVVVRKKDGAFLYTTTDLACVKHCCEAWKAHRILYYTDSRQQTHLSHVKKIARRVGFLPPDTKFEHHTFGMILGKNRKPFQTRTGKTIKLSNLLDEAFTRSYKIIRKKQIFTENRKNQKLAQVISVGAVKYFDLSKNRIHNYVFDWDMILNFEGNTAIYIQYAYVRIVSVLQRVSSTSLRKSDRIILQTRKESEIVLHLLQYEEVIRSIEKHGTPHLLCNFLYRLTTLFSSLYRKHSILKEKNNKIRCSRILLFALIQKTIKHGLNLLGIQVMKKM